MTKRQAEWMRNKLGPNHLITRQNTETGEWTVVVSGIDSLLSDLLSTSHSFMDDGELHGSLPQRDGVWVTYFPDTDEITVAGVYDCCCNAGERTATLVEFLSILRITPHRLREAADELERG